MVRVHCARVIYFNLSSESYHFQLNELFAENVSKTKASIEGKNVGKERQGHRYPLRYYCRYIIAVDIILLAINNVTRGINLDRGEEKTTFEEQIFI